MFRYNNFVIAVIFGYIYATNKNCVRLINGSYLIKTECVVYLF